MSEPGEKWKEVEEDLVEQALVSFENEMATHQLQSGHRPSIAHQEAALARAMWQLDRDIAHAEELRTSEWASMRTRTADTAHF